MHSPAQDLQAFSRTILDLVGIRHEGAARAVAVGASQTKYLTYGWAKVEQEAARESSAAKVQAYTTWRVAK